MDLQQADFERSNAGLYIGRRHHQIMTSERLTYEDFVFISKFVGDYQLVKSSEDSSRLNTVLDVYNGITDWSPSAIQVALDDNPKFVQQLRGLFFMSFSLWLQQSGDPFVSTIVRGYSPSITSKFRDFSDHFWLKWAGSSEEAGETAIILGAKGSGKTDFCLLIGEIAERNGWIVATNIKTPGFAYFTTFSEMLGIIVQNAMNKLRTLVIIDEMTVAGMRRQRSQGSEGLNLEELQRLTRKFNTSMILVWHLDKDVTTEMKQTVSMLVQKNGSVQNVKGRKIAKVSFRIGNKFEEHTISGIPQTGIDYQTNDVAPFVLDIKLRDILRQVVESDNVDLYESILNFLQKPSQEVVHESS